MAHPARPTAIFRLKGISVSGDQNASTNAAAKNMSAAPYMMRTAGFAAAFVEAFWSPLTEIPYNWKIGVGIGAWVVLLAYFLLAGRVRAAR